MEERRLLLAVFLSLLVLTGYRMLFPPPPAPETGSAAPASASAAPSVAPIPAASPAPQAAPTPAIVVASVADEKERRVEVVGDDLSVAFTNRGARLVSWRLARFKDAAGHQEEMVQTLPGGVRPLEIETGEADLDARLRDALFRPSTETLHLPPAGEAVLSFEYAGGDVVARKTLKFRSRGYLASIAVEVFRGDKPLPVRLLWGPGVGNPSAAEMEVQGYLPPHAVALPPGAAEPERIKVEKIGQSRAFPEVAWVGVEGHYFVALMVPPGGRGTGSARAVDLPALEDGKKRQGPVAVVDVPAHAGEVQLYVGPKDYPSLARLDPSLARVVPVGTWIGPIVVLLMRLLQLVHGSVGNYGWSIVALTVLINLVLSPLRHYSIANGFKMQKLAPELKVIQERYRGIPALDKRREQMQHEMSAVYARHGMSMGSQMLVGCLPLLLTMPFLIAFYRVLQVSVELRGASFLWLPDLSQKDPFFITPLLMGGSMFLMQKMTPTAMDPAQQRMMTMMPMVLMVMFFAAPAGLNLYWLASNVCSILQQAVTRRIVHAGEASAKRRR